MADDKDPLRLGLTSELFHADTDREPGDTNIQMSGFNFQPHVMLISAVLILAFIAYTIIFTDSAAAAYDTIFNGINANFGWFYIIASNIFILVVLYFGLSKYGNIRIGGVDAEKEFTDVSWVAMLFSAGMGIGLMFWSVAEPMWHFADPLFGVEGQSEAAAEVAMAVTYFHWAFHPWAIYGVVGLAIAFFSFNRGLPMTFRSVFWPILGERIYGWPGHVVDILAVFATLFGLGTSLGIGALQINAGLTYVGGEVLGVTVPDAVWVQVVLIGIITAIAVVSVAAGLHKGVRVLSNINVGLMLLLMFSVLIVGPTLFLLGLIPQAIGTYLTNFPELALWTDTFGTGPYEGWQGFWTVFYWGWWIAWSPFVGMFIARISIGRTVREFVAGVMILPVVFSFVFMGILGGSALHFELFTDQSVIGTVFDVGEEVAMFELFTLMPLTIALSILAVILVTTFFVTSSDSGSLVLGHLSSGGMHQAPRNQRITWAVFEGVVASALLIGGGLFALQTASITVGLPFAFVLLIMCYSTWKGLKQEYKTLQSEEFEELVDELVDRRGVVISRSGGDVVTGIVDTRGDAAMTDGDDSAGDVAPSD